MYFAERAQAMHCNLSETQHHFLPEVSCIRIRQESRNKTDKCKYVRALTDFMTKSKSDSWNLTHPTLSCGSSEPSPLKMVHIGIYSWIGTRTLEF